MRLVVVLFAPQRGTLLAPRGGRRMMENWQARVAAWRARRAAIRDQPHWTALSELKAGVSGRKGEGAVARELERLGVVALNDVILADDCGLTQIDHLVRSATGVLVLETKTLSGRISGTPLCRAWVQQIGSGESATVTTFQNPLWQNLRHVQAVEAVVAPFGVPVSGHVVSAGAAQLADELRPVVVPLGEIGRLVGVPEPGRTSLEAAWRALVAAAESGEARRGEHAETLRRRRAR